MPYDANDLLDLYSANDATAAASASALANAIRQRRAAGTLGLITGDPGMAAVGKEIGGQADRLEQGLMGAAQNRASMEMQRRHLDNQLEQIRAMMGYRQGMLGIQQQNADTRTASAARPEYGVNSNTGETFVRKPGASLPGAVRASGGSVPNVAPAPAPVPGGPPATGGAVHPLAGKMLDKQLKDLGADFDPNGGRSGEFGKNQARVNAANRLLQLATDEQGNPKDLNPQQMPELSQALASLISGGGQGAQAQIEHLTPHTLRGNLQGTMQWLFGEPRGADQVAFVQNMIDTAKRERGVAQQAIESVRQQRSAKHQVLLTRNPNESRKVLEGFGYTLDDKGNVVQKQAGGADQIPVVQSPDDARKLAPGTKFKTPDGRTLVR